MPDDEGTGFGGAPLPPEDRLWRHPSEVHGPRPERDRRWSLLPVGVGVLVGASAAVVGLWAIGTFDGGPRPSVAEERLATPVSTVFVGRAGVGGLDQVAEGLVALRIGGVDGAGVVLRDDGHVLTTAALVGDRRRVQVWGVDGRQRDGEVVGTDPATDVAVIRVPELTAPGAVLGRSAEVGVGDGARAVNLQRGGAALVLDGRVANLAVTVALEDDARLHGLIGTDIVRSDPVEGAALIDGSGAVIGVTTDVGDSEVLRAVPIDLARIVAHDIIATGEPDHPWLGIEGRDLPDDVAAEWGIAGGAEVAEVVEDGPAAEAGLEPEDVVTNVGDTAIRTMGDLLTTLRHLDPGDGIRVGYLRDGEQRWCDVVLAEAA
ncbi:MAG TPA: S1C family serine protease [Acidimicrobiales bacterium]|nr:S1C family serine protease [Acidimicrobiales bacterium]